MTRTSMNALLLALGATLVFAPGVRAQEDETISVPLSDPSKPAWVRVGLVAGSIDVEAYDGAAVLVRVTSEMEEVGDKEKDKEKNKEKDKGEKEEVKKDREGLRRIPNTSRGMTVEEEDNEVEISVDSWKRAANLEIKVPRKTSLKLMTVNQGDIAVRGVEGELELGNTNGSITALGVRGSVVAHTINGEIRVSFDAVTPGKAMSFGNLNGDIDVTFPPDLRANLLMRSDMGEILTDFDFKTVATTRKSSDPGEGKGFRMKIEKQIEAQVGGGGPEIVFKNFNGDILIRKGG